MRRTIDEARDLTGRLAGMQQDARALVAELRKIVGVLGAGGMARSHRGDEVARKICDRRDAELFEELARVMGESEGETFLRRR